MLAISLASTTRAGSQTLTSAVVGTVTDATHSPLANAAITLLNADTSQQLVRTTAADGTFAFTDLPPGTYQVSARTDGFRAFVASNVALDPDTVARIAVQLEIGPLTDQVTVNAGPSLVHTDTAARSEVVADVFVGTLPLNGRNYLDLAFLAPGVYKRVGDDTGDGLATNGTRWDATGFTLDGVTNRADRNGNSGVAVSLDAIREVNVQTSTYAAEYGRSAGAQVGVVTRAGSNRFAATAADYVRSDRFDARNAFAAAGQPSTLSRQQPAATAGGPIVRKRTFFFASVEKIHQRQSQFASSTAPNADWLSGDLRSVRGVGADGIWGNADDTNRIVHPFTRQEFPTPNVIPATLIDPIAKRILPFIPAANSAGSLDGYAAQGLALTDRPQFLVKIDHVLSASTMVTARWAHSDETSTDPFPSQRVYYPGFSNHGDTVGDSGVLSAVTRIGARWVHDARVGYFRQRVKTTGEQAGTNYVAQLGLTGLTQDPATWGFPTIRIDGFSEFGDRPNNPSDYTLRNLQFTDTATWLSARHAVKAGVDVVQSRYDELDLRAIRGDFRFRGRGTNPGSGTSSGFRSFADFLLGVVDQSQRQIGSEPARLTGWQTALFIQDQWQASPSLTISLGLRYEKERPLVEANNRLANFVPSLGAVVLAGDSRYPASLVSDAGSHLAPRLGWAWRPFNDVRTVVRGGGGIFYSLEGFNIARQQMAVSYPFVQREQFTRASNAAALTLATPFPDGLGALQGVNAPLGMAANYDTPEYFEYNVTVERELRPGLAVEIGYVGSQGRFLGRRYNLNQFIPTGLLADGTLATVRPYPQFADIQFQDQTVNSSYNALQATVRRRMNAGLSLLASYTLGRSIDTGSNSAGNLSNVSTTGAQKAPQDIYNLAAERGPSDFDRRHQFSGAVTFDLPFGTGQRWLSGGGIATTLAGGWQTSAILTAWSGRPFTPQYSAGDFATQRPNLASDPMSNIPAGLWFNPAAFAKMVATAANPNQYGNAGRNILTGPGYQTLDVALTRAIPVSRARLQFRVEAFNVLNRANYQVPVFLLDASNVGRVTATAGDARQLQFGARLSF